ncbi:TetR/AcrR family transcriptional regulator [Jatrophihabitans sp. DSM 45814]
MTVDEVSGTVQAAVDRALSKQRDDATREVEAILDAALRVAERVAPATPRVADIVAEAGTSNQAFYRYFAGKDDLMKAVFERGLVRLHTYLEHQIAKETDPPSQIAAWIRGVLNQAIDRRAARQSAAINLQLGPRDSDDTGPPGALRALLLQPVIEAGSSDPERDANAIVDIVFATMRRHIRKFTAPSAADCDHLIHFCLRGLTRD